MKLLSPHPWTYTEDALCYYVRDAKGQPIGVLFKGGRRHAESNLAAVLALPDLLEGFRTQPAYGELWKKKLREAYACASGLVDHFLPARKRKK
jgi:hypothetical protein